MVADPGRKNGKWQMAKEKTTRRRSREMEVGRGEKEKPKTE